MMSVASWSGTLIDWKSALVELKSRIAPALGRSETRFSASAFVDGLLSGAERKTGWMLADALYGADSGIRRMLENRRQAYVLATRSNPTLRFLEDDGLIQTDPAALAEDLDADAWSPLSAGEGAKGPRLYEWARPPIGFGKNNGFARWLLFRRYPGPQGHRPEDPAWRARPSPRCGCRRGSLRDPKALAYYFAHAPEDTSLQDIAGAAGLRWTVEECFPRAKDDLGLDHCEARSWHGWHRHMTLVMAAAFLAKLAADQRRHAFGKRIDATLEAKAA